MKDELFAIMVCSLIVCVTSIILYVTYTNHIEYVKYIENGYNQCSVPYVGKVWQKEPCNDRK